MKLSEQMLENLRLFCEKHEATKGTFPTSHSSLEALGIRVYLSGETLEKTKGFFQLGAFRFNVNINGMVETNCGNIDDYKPLLIGKFLAAFKETLEKGTSIKTKYKEEDFFGDYDTREQIVEKQIVKEVENPTHKVKAALLDKLLFEREATFREPQY